MSGPFHDGELEAQHRAGVRDLGERVGRIIRPTIPAAAAEFLAEQSMVIAATTTAAGDLHASVLGGPKGFAHAITDSLITFLPTSGHIETVLTDVAQTGRLGVLAIDFATKRRMRVNGEAVLEKDAIVLSTHEFYSNCQQHIRQRDDSPALRFERRKLSTTLTETQRRTIASASTFFIASAHPERGADASHRGGTPGFVCVEADRLSWLDYPGNNMFNTIGNLLVNPRCALLFIDFDRGGTLQIEGTASVQWEPERRIEVIVERLLETQ